MMSLVTTPHDDRDETPTERLDRNWNDILQELRVALTGTQLISGFLLAVAFQQGFDELSPIGVTHYLVLVALATVATLLGLAPVMVHRLQFGKRKKDSIVHLGNRLLITTLVVVSLLTIGVASFIFEFVVSEGAGMWAALVAGVFVLALWLIAASVRSHGDGAASERS